MMRTPLTLITGFGWDAYAVMPFHYATHNYYLGLWFELGIAGVALFVFIMTQVIVTARKALEVPGNELRPYLVGFLFGILPLTVAIFFGDLTNPWPYVWIYIGIAMRAALLVLGSDRQPVPSKRSAVGDRPAPAASGRPRPRAPAPGAVRRTAHGWHAPR
jgi:O-antigen ligase